jgi:hypothetical protein
MFLRLSSFNLSGIIILVFSKQKGLTLVFRNDPVDSVKVSSTFNSIPAIQRFLQAEIETLLRDLMREEVPAIIHKLSLEWATRNQAQECSASLTNTQRLRTEEKPGYQYSLEMEPNDPLRPILAETNLLRLVELHGAPQTLSLFTPSLPNSVVRSSTSCLSQSHLRYSRRRDWPSIKSSEVVDQVQSSTYISPPESIHSGQSVETSSVSTRPSLHYRQRSTYLRRPLQPKRKVVRLNLKPAASEMTTSNNTASHEGEHCTEGGDFTYTEYAWDNKDAMLESKFQEAALQEEVWLRSKGSFSLDDIKRNANVSSGFSGSTVVGSSDKGEWNRSPAGERVLPNYLKEKGVVG